MTPAFFLAILCLLVASGVLALDPSLDAEWEEWKETYEKSYSKVCNLGTLRKNRRVHWHCCCKHKGTQAVKVPMPQ